MSKTIQFICAAVTGFCIAGTHAQAVTTIVDAGGFESYALGDLAGQPGGAGSWREASFAPVGPQSTAVVQDLVDHPYPSGGTKAVKVDRKANDDAYWAVPVSSYPLPNNDLIIIEWDMKVEPANVVDGFGPLFGIQAFDGAASPLLLGSVGVDANTGEILYQETITGILTPIEPSLGILVDDQWHQYRMAIDYTNRAYQVVYDGQLILTEPIVDSAAVGFTDADIAAIAANIDANSQNAEGTAYFDNFIVVNFDRLPGDYDIDGDVDANDYAVWRETYGATTVAGVGADGNGDGVVNAADYTVWRDNFPSAVQGPTAGSSPAPEPAATALCCLGAAGVGACRRRR